MHLFTQNLSKKTCSCCGHVLDSLELSSRTYACPVCGMAMDRDENAAVNICEEEKRIFPDYLKKILKEKQAVRLKPPPLSVSVGGGYVHPRSCWDILWAWYSA